jgi:hypothetical protein
MNSKMVIVIVVQFILACEPLNRQAAAQDRDQDPEQLWNIGWELSQDCLNHRDSLRVKDKRQHRHRGRLLSIHRQSDLLRELLRPGDIRYEPDQVTEDMNKMQRISSVSREKDIRILDELLVEASIP